MAGSALDEMVPSFEEDTGEVATDTETVVEETTDAAEDAAADDAGEPATDVETEGAAEEGEIDYTKIDAEKLPRELVERTPHARGLLRELQETRETVRALRDKRPEPAAVEEPDPVDELDDDEVLTVGQLKAMRAKEQEKAAKQQAAREASERERVENESFTALKAELSEDKTGKGLDAVTVLKDGLPWLVQNEPDLFAAARRSKDPARRLYQLCRSLVPAIADRAEAAKTAGVVQKLKGGPKPRGTAGASSRGGVKDVFAEALAKGDEDAIAGELAKLELEEE